MVVMKKETSRLSPLYMSPLYTTELYLLVQFLVDYPQASRIVCNPNLARKILTSRLLRASSARLFLILPESYMSVRVGVCLRTFTLACLVSFFGLSAQAQIANVTGSTITPTPGTGHDYIGMLNETVDPASGNLSLRFNIPVPRGRGLTIPFAFTYDSNGSFPQPKQGAPGVLEWSSSKGVFPGAWSNTLPQLSASLLQYAAPGNYPPVYCYASTGYMFTDPAGGKHALGLSAVLSYYNPNIPPGNPSCPSANNGNPWTNVHTAGDSFYRGDIAGVDGPGGYDNEVASTAGPGVG